MMLDDGRSRNSGTWTACARFGDAAAWADANAPGGAGTAFGPSGLIAREAGFNWGARLPVVIGKSLDNESPGFRPHRRQRVSPDPFLEPQYVQVIKGPFTPWKRLKYGNLAAWSRVQKAVYL